MTPTPITVQKLLGQTSQQQGVDVAGSSVSGGSAPPARLSRLTPSGFALGEAQGLFAHAEAVIGEVAFLEATLRSTLEQRRGTPLAAIQGQKDQDLGYVLEAEPGQG